MDHPERIPAVIPVTAAVMITVRPEPLKIIPVPYLLIPNAEQPASAVRAVRPEQVHHITERFLQLPNADLVTNAAIPAVPAQQAQAAVPDMKPTMSDRPNAVLPAIAVGNILTPTLARAVISGYTTSSTRSKSCSCGATSGTCYKCTKNTNTGNNNNNNTNTGTTTPAVDPDACKSTYIIGVSYAGWCDWCDEEGGTKCIWCKRERRCTTNSGKDKWLNDGYYIAKSGYDGEVNCQAALAGGGKNCDEGTIYPE